MVSQTYIVAFWLYLTFSWKEKKDLFAKDLFLRSKKSEKERKIFFSIVEIKEKQICYGMYFVDLLSLMENDVRSAKFTLKLKCCIFYSKNFPILSKIFIFD